MELNGLIFDIPQGYFDIPIDSCAKKDDRVAHVTRKFEGKIGALNSYLPSLSWLSVDESEIGKLKKFIGKVVIRKID